MSDPIEVRVPDIGDFEDVEVVEVLVSPGDAVVAEDSLVTLESDKASMEIPSPTAGTIEKLAVEVGDKVSEGSLLLVLRSGAAAEAAPASVEPADAPGARATEEAQAAQGPEAEEEIHGGSDAASVPEPVDPPRTDERLRQPGASSASEPPVAAGPVSPSRSVHASPLVRAYARDLGVDLGQAQGTGPQGRIVVEDVKQRVREAVSAPRGDAAGAIPAIPEVDFSKFGEVEERKLGRIRRVSARNLSRSWLNLPHVTQHEDADITELEDFRKSRADEAAERGVRISPLLFVMKAVVRALRDFPDFRSSLAPGGEHLIVKHYYHLGVAVDTEGGLVVPVVRDVDRKGVFELAEEVAFLAEKARTGKLSPGEMQGACFTISSLGGIGGTAFTPIVNAPEVAILGVSRTDTRPVWVEDDGPEGGHFAPRRILPLSLSYDHRVIDGASAVRFVVRLRETLGHPANLLL